MTRKADSGWRDRELNQWHEAQGFPCPAAGMAMPMIEYDRGKAVGLINYVRRGDDLPTGAAVASAYRAFGRLHDSANSAPLPFLTAVYDPRNWAMRLFPHNPAATKLLPGLSDHNGWAHHVSEQQFAKLLYGMRGRSVPDMFGYGVEWAEGSWLALEPLGRTVPLPFPCADMSARRRSYEPGVAAPMRTKLPCLDVDLAVVDPEGRLALVVDYKRTGAICDVNGTNATALASLAHPSGQLAPALMTRYWGSRASGWFFEAYPLNGIASSHLAYVLGCNDAPASVMAKAVAGGQWVRLIESHWLDVLRVARDL